MWHSRTAAPERPGRATRPSARASPETSRVFTGIVTHRARLLALDPAPGAAVVRVEVALDRPLGTVVVGDSVALDGCCLTVVAIRDGGACLAFEAVPETLRKTTLGARRVGDRLNVEAALRLGDPLGGHLVAGHVDGVGRVTSVSSEGGDVRLVVELPETLRGSTIPKGSITVDGVSLTVGECGDTWCSVYLIPHTLAVTGLDGKRVGDGVNLEADLVGRYVEHHVRRWLAASAAAPGTEA